MVVHPKCNHEMRREEMKMSVFCWTILWLLWIVGPAAIATATTTYTTTTTTTTTTNEDDLERLTVTSSMAVDDITLEGGGSTPSDDDDDDDDEYTTCRVWLAESTIPGAGFGMFAGINYNPGEQVTPGDLVVPYLDLAWHNSVEDEDELAFLWNDYSWDLSGFDWMDQEGLDVSAASFGIGAVPNCWLPLVNVDDSTTDYDTAGLHRSQDPGAGAITPYHNRIGYATASIPAGMELFVDYGYEYFESRSKVLGPVPHEEDYKAGDDLMASFQNLMSDLGWSTLTCNEKVLRCDSNKVDGTVLGFRKDLYDVVLSLKNSFFSSILATMSTDAMSLDYAYEYGVRFSEYERSIRPIEWLKDNGSCMDNLQAGQSLIPQAGRGAFARRELAQGDVVAPVPLIHVDRNLLYMYDRSEPDHEHPAHMQLLLNYCIGHRDTFLLLCPYGVGTALVNHSRKHPNTKLVWSNKLSRHPEWLQQHPSEWIGQMKAGLAFDLVATRDIRQGEEVLLDYGEDFQRAWDEHVKNWTPPPNADLYSSAHKLEFIDKLPTTNEGSYLSETKEIFCRDEFRVVAGLEKADYELHNCRIADRSFNENTGEYRYRAEIIERFEDIQVKGKSGFCSEVSREVLFDVPRDCFYIEDSFYSRDHAQFWSFRHEMRWPDDLMPDSWIDVTDD